MPFIFRLFIVMFLQISLGLGCALADCTKDRSGAVYCSQHPGGGAVRDASGSVVCGKGQCRRDRSGNVRCSTVIGGGMDTDYNGTAQCLGGCEIASSAQCSRGTE